MIIRALLVIASGFFFIFSPGLPMSLISRFSPDYKRDLVYWGIGIWLITLIPSLFFQSLLRQIFYQGQAVSYSGRPLDYGITLINALIAALLLAAGIRIVLRTKAKKHPKDDPAINGLAMGFGIGLVAQVFTGLNLVGAGFRILFGDTTSVPILEALANNSFTAVVLSLLAVILFRIALLAVSAVQGYFTAQSLQGNRGAFWMGVVVSTAFTWIILAIHLLLGEQVPGQVIVGITRAPISIISIAYYLIAFLAAYWWLAKALSKEK